MKGKWSLADVGITPQSPAPPTEDVTRATLDDNRCAICGWTLAATIEDGCVRGSCSLRPPPAHHYDPKRAKREFAHLKGSPDAKS